MRVKVTFLGTTREYSSNEVLMLEIDPSTTVADVLRKIIEKQPKIEKISKYLFIAVNKTLVPRNLKLSEDDEISLFFGSGGG